MSHPYLRTEHCTVEQPWFGNKTHGWPSVWHWSTALERWALGNEACSKMSILIFRNKSKQPPKSDKKTNKPKKTTIPQRKYTFHFTGVWKMSFDLRDFIILLRAPTHTRWLSTIQISGNVIFQTLDVEPFPFETRNYNNGWGHNEKLMIKKQTLFKAAVSSLSKL